MHSLTVLLLVASLVTVKTSAHCDETACNMLTADMLLEWPRHKPIPSQEFAVSFAYGCHKALECYKMIECTGRDEELSQKIADLGEICSGIRAFGGPLGQCFQEIQKRDTSQEYPCLKYWDNPTSTPTCEFFTSDYDCAEMLVENQCGTLSLEVLKMNKRFISEHFGCFERNK